MRGGRGGAASTPERPLPPPPALAAAPAGPTVPPFVNPLPFLSLNPPPLPQNPTKVLDKYFGNVCELDLIFNFHKARARVRRGGGLEEGRVVRRFMRRLYTTAGKGDSWESAHICLSPRPFPPPPETLTPLKP